jgi:hypothetical protein
MNHSDQGRHSDQGIVKDQKGQEQPKDQERAQMAQKTGTEGSVSREATRDSGSGVSDKTSGSR